MKSLSNARQPRIVIGMGMSLLLLLIMVTFIGRALAAAGLAADLESSYKAVAQAEAEAGETLQYTVLISNTGSMSVTNLLMKDTLPAEVAYQTDSLTVTAGSNYVTAVYGENSGVITWTGTLSGQGYLALSFNAVLTEALAPGVVVTNTAVITGTGSWLTRTASTTIVEPAMPQIFLPAIWYPLPAPELQLSVPVNHSQWDASWSNIGSGISYELQESNTPDFANKTTYTTGAGITSQSITHNTPDIYYYRVRGVLNGQVGLWSETRSVLVGQLHLSRSPVNQYSHWSVGWTSGGSGVSLYELQEARSEVFNLPQIYMVDSARSYIFHHDPSPDNDYCYRVRAVVDDKLGEWSNVECLVGGYYDDFSDDSTNWAIRRQDTDDVDNHAYYRSKHGEQYFVLEIDGRWDYGLASPLRRAPELPYVIESRVRLNEPDNLNTYGFVFGGDWDGVSECPNEDYSDCFNHYYRLMFLYYGDTHHLRLQLKRIDRHEGSNIGRGKNLISFRDVFVGGNSIGFKTWRIEISEDGTIEIFVNGNLVATAHDTEYIHNPYFGVFAATDEYLGAEPWYDWYRVMPLPEE